MDALFCSGRPSCCVTICLDERWKKGVGQSGAFRPVARIGPIARCSYCMGSSLARAEIRIFLEEWLVRIPDFTIAQGATLTVKVGAAAMLQSLPLVWEPRP